MLAADNSISTNAGVNSGRKVSVQMCQRLELQRVVGMLPAGISISANANVNYGVK